VLILEGRTISHISRPRPADGARETLAPSGRTSLGSLPPECDRCRPSSSRKRRTRKALSKRSWSTPPKPKDGIVLAWSWSPTSPGPVLRKALNLAVDGNDLQRPRSMMNWKITVRNIGAKRSRMLHERRRYSPRSAISGAGPGLIQVMKDLADIEKGWARHRHGLGRQPSTASLFRRIFSFLPVSGKSRRTSCEAQLREPILKVSSQRFEGQNPTLSESSWGLCAGISLRRRPAPNVREYRLTQQERRVRRKLPPLKTTSAADLLR